MISHIASYIVIFPVPEWRRPVALSFTSDCDTWGCKQVQEYLFFKKETDIGHEAFESSSHRRLQTSSPPQIQLSKYLFTFSKPLSSGPKVEEGLGLLVRNSWELEQSLSLNLHPIACGVSCATSTLPPAASPLSSCDTVWKEPDIPVSLIASPVHGFWFTFLSDNWRAAFSKQNVAKIQLEDSPKLALKGQKSYTLLNQKLPLRSPLVSLFLSQSRNL